MFTVITLYHFTKFSDPGSLRPSLLELCKSNNVRGTILIATEGINGTIAGSDTSISKVITHIKNIPNCNNIKLKKSFATSMPFARLKVRLKREIVTMGQPEVNPISGVGHYVDPSHWDTFTNDPNVVLIDTRNDYEIGIGTFKGSINPGTKSFREFPKWWESNKERFADKKVAMFCTGGIRCEKSTNYLLNQGVKDVFHLDGGILKYLEETTAKNSSWEGECFVFDGRVSVGFGLKEGNHSLCFACRRPLQPEDIKKPGYEAGVSCHQCLNECSDNDRTRFRERQRQILLARKLGKSHIGPLD